MTRAMAMIKRHQAEEWADQITVQLGRTVESIIEVGRLLIASKKGLPHGEFGRMFTDNLVPFGQRTADRLMAIAANPVLSNSTHGSNLPPSWRTLYELTKVDQPKLKAALKDGLITPDLKRRDLVALLPPSQSVKRAPLVIGARTPSGRLYFQIARLLSDNFDALAAEDQDDLLGMLEQTIVDLRERRQKEMPS
jgi:hypothetical protein